MSLRHMSWRHGLPSVSKACGHICACGDATARILLSVEICLCTDTGARGSLSSPDMVLPALVCPKRLEELGNAATPKAVDSTGPTACKLRPGWASSILRADLALTERLHESMEVTAGTRLRGLDDGEAVSKAA